MVITENKFHEREMQMRKEIVEFTKKYARGNDFGRDSNGLPYYGRA